MKKLLNAVEDLVPQALRGLALAHPGIALLQDHWVALRADVQAVRSRGEVALLSGGGAGHEPAHAGYVGPGLLTAAVAGEVFTSPSADAVLAAIEAVAGPGGVLLIVKNYTGDRLNFGLAAEIARSRGHRVEMVVVADDVALAAGADHAGRRGLAGTVLVHKVAGASAAAGRGLADVRDAAQAAAQALGTMGVALTPCTVPAAGSPGFDLGPDEIELGLGIHGEAGVQRTRLVSADTLVDRLLSTIVADLGLAAGERVALLVNNLGGTPQIELSLVTGSALRWLATRGLRTERVWSGSFLTALEMAGVSLSLLRLDDERLDALDAPAAAPAWPANAPARPLREPTLIPAPTPRAAPVAAEPSALRAPLAQSLRAIAAALEAAEPELTRLDQQVGDGDLGLSLARGAQALRQALPTYPLHDLPATLRALAATLRRALGGTSGPLYAIGLLSGAQALERSPADAAAALAAAAQAIAEVGGAQRGDRTMLDALWPAAEAWAQAQAREAPWAEALREAAHGAQQGTDATATLTARRGRSSYLGQRAHGHVDPGARAVALWLAALAEHHRAA